MNTPAVDFSFIYELSENDSRYIYEVINVFLEAIPAKLLLLEQAVNTTGNYSEIEELAHFLKSSSSVIKIRDMFANMVKIEALARGKKSIDEIKALLSVVRLNFNEAMPLLLSERDKHYTQSEDQSLL